MAASSAFSPVEGFTHRSSLQFRCARRSLRWWYKVGVGHAMASARVHRGLQGGRCGRGRGYCSTVALIDHSEVGDVANGEQRDPA